MPPYDPNKDPRFASTTAPPSTQPKTREQALAEVDKLVGKAKKKGNANAAANLGSVADSLSPHEGGYDPLSALSLIPAVVGAALTPDSYLVGGVGTGSYQKAGDMSLAQQLFSDRQLGIADPLKAAIATTEEQRAYLEGTAPSHVNWGMGILEGVGVIGDIVTDPLNLLGGIGMTDDAFKALDDLGKVDKTLAKLTEEAATATPESVVSRAKAAVEGYHSALDDLDAAVSQGMDPLEAGAQKVAARDAFRQEWSRLNGEALLAGDSTLSKARYTRDGMVHEAPFGARARASTVHERLSEHTKDIATYMGGEENFSTVAQSDIFKAIPLYGGKSADELARDAWQRGYAALSPGPA
jgi:hypothetical protein